MIKSNLSVIERLRIVRKRIDRLRVGFGLEKEDVLADPSPGALNEFRERSRSFYVIRLAGLRREILRLSCSISPELPGMEEAEDMVKACMEEAADLRAQFVATPSRLIRSLGGEGSGEED